MGAGRIGAMYDSPGDAMTLTHCHAYAKSPRIELAGVVDADPAVAREAGNRWHTEAFTSIPAASAATRPDIVSVCTPVGTRKGVVESVLAGNPKFVFLEKPIASGPEDLREMAGLLAASGAACMVNYPRLFDSAVTDVAGRAAAGEFGEFLTGVACYSKGLRNNGSHLIGLVERVLGPAEDFKVLGRRVDFHEGDPSLGVLLELGNGATFHIVPVDETAYSIIDVTFFFREARVHFRNFGLEVCITRPRQDPVFPGYRDLENQDQYIATALGSSMDVAVRQIVAFLDERASFASDLASAVRTEHLIDRMMMTEKNGSE